MNARRSVGLLVGVLFTASSVLHATLTDSGTGSISGQVVDGTTLAPVSGATVKLVHDSPGGCEYCFASTDLPNVLTGPDGRFTFGSLPAGVYVVRAAKPGYPIGAFGVRRPSGDPASIQVPDGARVDGLTIPLFRRAVVSGTITDRDGDPVVDSTVAFLRRIPVVQSALVNGLDVVDHPFEVAPGQDVGGIVLTLVTRSSTIAGLVLSPDDNPARDALVIAFPTNRRDWLPDSRRIALAVPDSRGRYELTGLPAGEYLVGLYLNAPAEGEWDTALLEAIVPCAVKVTIEVGEKRELRLRVVGK